MIRVRSKSNALVDWARSALLRRHNSLGDPVLRPEAVKLRHELCLGSCRNLYPKSRAESMQFSTDSAALFVNSVDLTIMG